MIHKILGSNLDSIQNIQEKPKTNNTIQSVIKMSEIDLKNENNNNTKNVINEITNILNDTIEFKNHNISFDYDSEAEIFYVKLTNNNETEVIQQYPTKDFIEKLKMYRKQNKQDLNIFLDVKS